MAISWMSSSLISSMSVPRGSHRLIRPFGGFYFLDFVTTGRAGLVLEGFVVGTARDEVFTVVFSSAYPVACTVSQN